MPCKMFLSKMSLFCSLLWRIENLDTYLDFGWIRKSPTTGGIAGL